MNRFCLVVSLLLFFTFSKVTVHAQGPWCCQCSTCVAGGCWAVFSRQRESVEACVAMCAGYIGTDAYTSRYACGTRCIPLAESCDLLRYYVPLILK